MTELELDLLASGFDRAHRVDAIDVATLAGWKKEERPLLIFDVRTKEEQAVSQIEGAVLLLPGEDPWQRSELRGFLKSDAGKQAPSEDEAHRADTDKYIVVYCAVGARSGAMTRRLLDGSATGRRLPENVHAYNLHGGIFTWANRGYPLMDPKTHGPTRRVHGYNAKWAAFLHPPAEAVLP